MTADLDVLPRGRHHLSREQVSASQRSRMLLGMAEAVAERGYASATVADVLKRAGTSRETFYEHFANKQECFMAAYDEGVRQLTAAMRDAVPADGTALERFEGVLDAYLAAMAAAPQLAHTFLIDVYAAGPAAHRRRAEVLERFGDVVFDLLGDQPPLRDLPDPRFAVQGLVGAISSLVTGLVAAGDYGAIPGLKAPIMELLRAVAEIR